MIPQPPAITPGPLWKRAYLQAGTPVMALVTQAGLLFRDLRRALKTAVCGPHPLVNRRGMPTRHHPERVPGRQVSLHQWVADLEPEATAAVPTDLAPFLTRDLSPLAIRLLAGLPAPRRQS